MRRVNCLLALGTGVAFAGGVMFTAGAAQATVLTNQNTSVTVTDIAGLPDHAITSWTVDGVEQNPLTNYYYRVGSGTASPFSSLTYVSHSISTFLGSTRLTTTYADPGGAFSIVTKYTVIGAGAGSGASDIGVQIRVIANPNLAPTDFSVFELSNMNLNSSGGNDTATSAPVTHDVTMTDPSGTVFAEGSLFTVVNGNVTLPSNPTSWAIGPAGSLLATFSGGGNLSNSTTPFGGDSEFANQWRFNLAGDPNGSASDVLIIIDKNINVSQGVIPEPASAMLGLMGISSLAGVLMGRRARKA